MKNLKDVITERLHITKQTGIYNYFPETREELKEILKERLAKDKDADLNDIDVSKITDIGIVNGYGLFEGLDPHNIKLDKWDVSNVTNMSYIFYYCYNFNSDLSNWDVSKVEDMKGMFFRCKKFEGKNLEKWDVSKIKDMTDMFYGCDSLKNKPSWYKV